METSLPPREVHRIPGWPIAGSLFPYLRDRLAFLLRAAASGEPVIRFRLDAPIYLLNDVRDIKHVLDSNYPNYDKTPRLTSQRGRQLSGSGLLTAMGDAHLAKRRMLQPVFTPARMASFADAIVKLTDRFTSAWHDGKDIDIGEEMPTLASAVIGRILYSADYLNVDRELADAFVVRRRYIQQIFLSLLPFPELLPTRLRRQYKSARQVIDRSVRARIAERRTDPSRYSDMLTMLAQLRDADGQPINDADLFDEAVAIAITGYETIGEALAWTCYLLTQNPASHQRLVEELHEVLNGRPPTAEDFPKLRYTQMVISESMRIYPPTWIYIRVSREADILPSGVHIPAGARLYVCPWIIHRDPRQFSDPIRFDPGRFTDAARKDRPKYAYFPFGGGPRICIGQSLAKLETTLVLARIFQNFSMELLPGQKIVASPGITLSPRNGIRVRTRRRAPSSRQ